MELERHNALFGYLGSTEFTGDNFYDSVPFIGPKYSKVHHAHVTYTEEGKNAGQK